MTTAQRFRFSLSELLLTLFGVSLLIAYFLTIGQTTTGWAVGAGFLQLAAPFFVVFRLSRSATALSSAVVGGAFAILTVFTNAAIYGATTTFHFGDLEVRDPEMILIVWAQVLRITLTVWGLLWFPVIFAGIYAGRTGRWARLRIEHARADSAVSMRRLRSIALLAACAYCIFVLLLRLAEPEAFTLVSSFRTPSNVVTDGIRTYYFDNFSLVVSELSDRFETPHELARVPQNTRYRAGAVSGHRLFVVGDQEISIFDVSDPQQPLRLGGCRPPGNLPGVIAVDGSLLIAENWNGKADSQQLHFFDISDLVNPLLVSSFSTPRGDHHPSELAISVRA